MCLANKLSGIPVPESRLAGARTFPEWSVAKTSHQWPAFKAQ
jgi:hypothetical protein